MPTMPDPAAPLPRRPGEPAAPVPAESPPAKHTARYHPLLGFAVLAGCLELGEGLKSWLGLILPGNMLGLFLLLALLAGGVVPLRWVEDAARWLLWLLPLLFMPIFILALRDRSFWLGDGGAFAGVTAAAALALMAFVGHLAQWLFARRPAVKERG